jgi:hypothetical protein
VLRPLIPFIDGILEMGRKALQRHTAHPVAADSRGDTGAAGGGIDDSPVRTRAQARARLVPAGRPACRSHTSWARRVRSIGTRPRRS